MTPDAGWSSQPAAGWSSQPAAGWSSQPAAGLQPAAGWSSQPAAGLQPAAGWTSQPAVFLDCFVASLLAMTFFIPSFRAILRASRRRSETRNPHAAWILRPATLRRMTACPLMLGFAVVPAGYWIPCHSRVGGNFAGMTKGGRGNEPGTARRAPTAPIPVSVRGGGSSPSGAAEPRSRRSHRSMGTIRLNPYGVWIPCRSAAVAQNDFSCI